MSLRLAKSALLSAGVHALFILPAIHFGLAGAPPKADVVRGRAILELEWVDPQPLDKEEGEEEQREKLGFKPQEAVVTPGAFSVAAPAGFRNPAPAYPWAARLRGWQGTVVLRVSVAASGLPERVEIAVSSGHAVLDQAALEALRAWRFVPARKGSQAVAGVVEIPVTFKLDESKEEL
ncbi:MAG: energy transducer TonB [Candidatus Omnitrophica bacterium]|nr:energy transducer TonB [Candidatus Omnitrophota bacterium]